jgi:integrase
VRWREAGAQRKRRFDSKMAAESFEAKRRVEPEVRLAAAGRALTVDTMMETWLASKGGLRPKTIDAAATDRREVLLTFTGRLASSVTAAELRVWTGRDRGAVLRRRSLMALRQAYTLALTDGLLTTNPCVGVALPKVAHAEPRFLSWDQLEALADACDQPALVWLLGTAGLRLGEAVGLTVADVDVKRGRVRVARTVAVTSRGAIVGPPKSGKGRDVPVAPFVLDLLHCSPPSSGPGGVSHSWLFRGVHGGRLDAHTWRETGFRAAAEAVGLPGLHPHALRHTAASLAIQAGADLLVVQRMLGHANPSITSNIYLHLFDRSLDSVAERMDATYRHADEADVIELKARRAR